MDEESVLRAPEGGFASLADRVQKARDMIKKEDQRHEEARMKENQRYNATVQELTKKMVSASNELSDYLKSDKLLTIKTPYLGKRAGTGAGAPTIKKQKIK